jgi:hypothetical protein
MLNIALRQFLTGVPQQLPLRLGVSLDRRQTGRVSIRTTCSAAASSMK